MASENGASTATFARGAALTTAATFGHADTSNLGPTAGNGFYKRWPDDLALLQELGITDLRLTFDWARLQPRPGDLDGAWVELFEQILAASEAIGLRVWATMHDGAEPRWITNEGGLGNDDVAEKWWPRFVERIADRFGPQLAGWIPFAGIGADVHATMWRNTWTTLNGGGPAVVAAIDADRADEISSYVETSDVIGLVIGHDEIAEPETPNSEAQPSNDQFAALRTRLLETIGAAAEHTGDNRLVVAQFTPHHADADVAGQIITSFVGAVDEAISEGIALDATFLDPAIAGPDSPVGLLSSDRTVQPTAAAYLPDVS